MMSTSQTQRPIVFGEALYDVFPDGAEVLGGAPLNVAWHLQGFGLRPLFVGARGRDERGSRLDAAFESWGLDRSGVQVLEDFPTGVVHAHVDGADVEYDIVEDVAWDHVDAGRAEDAVRTVEAACLVHGSLALRSHDTREALQRLREILDVRVLLDVNLRPPHTPLDRVRVALDHATWAKVNADELAVLTGSRPRSRAEIERATARLCRRHHLERAVVTLGRDGALAVGADGETAFAPSIEVEDFVDPIGAGDAFTSVLTVGMLRHWSLETTLARAHRFAGVICTVRGATPEDPAPYRTLEWRASNGA